MDYRLPFGIGAVILAGILWASWSGSGTDAANAGPYQTLEGAPWGASLWQAASPSSDKQSCKAHQVSRTEDWLTASRDGYKFADEDASLNAITASIKQELTARVKATAEPGADLWSEANGRALFVAPNGDDNWSGELAAPNADANDGPMRTLRAATERARDKRRLKTIFVREGTYYPGSTLRLGRGDTGLVIAAYPGELPVLSGGEPVEEIAKGANGVYEAKVSEPTGLDLIIAGQRAYPAQAPAAKGGDRVRSGWFTAQQIGGDDDAKSAFRLPGAAPNGAKLSPHAKVHLLTPKRWSDHIAAIDVENSGGRTYKLKDRAKYSIKDGATVRLLNDPSFLSKSTGFAWDPTKERLLIKAESNLEAAEIVVPRFGPVLDIADAKKVIVIGLTFSDVPFDQPAVQLSNSSQTIIAYNSFRHVGIGVKVSESRGGVLLANRFEGLGKTGVQFNPGTRDFLVAGNVFDTVGDVEFDGAGVWGIGVHDTVIAHNEFYNTSRYGVSLKDAGDTPNTNNRIEYNRLIRTNTKTADTGAIEMLGRSAVNTKTVIRQNFIYDTGGLATDKNGKWLERYQSSGVYLDDSTSGVVVSHNFMSRLGWSGVHVHGGDDVDISNNIALLDTKAGKFLKLQDWRDQKTGALERVSATRNVVYANRNIGPYWDYNRGGEPTIDRNVLHNVSKYKIKAMPEYGVVAHAGDAASIISEPGFRDARANDYRLATDSPAGQLGIENLEWQLMGAGPLAEPPAAILCAPLFGID